MATKSTRRSWRWPKDNATTKAGAIEWQTPAMTGPILGVVIDYTGKTRFRAYEVFSTYAAAKAWVDEKAGVGQTPVATPTATPAAGEVSVWRYMLRWPVRRRRGDPLYHR
jgi:hypothetical protein